MSSKKKKGSYMEFVIFGAIIGILGLLWAF
jgi:hypothetical protein